MFHDTRGFFLSFCPGSMGTTNWSRRTEETEPALSHSSLPGDGDNQCSDSGQNHWRISCTKKKKKKWFERQQKHRSGWWCNFTILKFDGLRQMGVWHSQYDGNVIPSSDPDLGIHGEAVLNNNPTTTSLVAWHTSKCISWVLCMWLTLHLSFKN